MSIGVRIGIAVLATAFCCSDGDNPSRRSFCIRRAGATQRPAIAEPAAQAARRESCRGEDRQFQFFAADDHDRGRARR